MKKAILMPLLLLCLLSFARAEGFDLADYALEGPFIVQPTFLDARNVAARCWEDASGAADRPISLAWWRDGTLYRQIEYAWGEDERALAPCGGDCRVLILDAKGDRRAVLYDWTDDGLSHPRVLAEGVIDHRETENGIALLRQGAEHAVLSLYDGQGRPEGDLEMAAGIDSLVRAARDGGGLWVVTVDIRRESNDYRPMVIRDGRVIWQGETGGLLYSAQMDGQGGYFVCESLSGDRYGPLTITRYDGQANRVWRGQLSGKKVVVSALSRIDPATGHLVLAGIASANSRGVRRVYRLEADAAGGTVSLDVRSCPAGEDVDVGLYLSPDTRELRALLRFANGRPAVWTPFEALPPGDDPNIKLE